jgi:hypothetical protein
MALGGSHNVARASSLAQTKYFEERSNYACAFTRDVKNSHVSRGADSNRGARAGGSRLQEGAGAYIAFTVSSFAV